MTTTPMEEDHTPESESSIRQHGIDEQKAIKKSSKNSWNPWEQCKSSLRKSIASKD